MKRIFFILSLLIFSVTASLAQSNGNSGSSNSGNGFGCGNTGDQMPAWVSSCLSGSGQVPTNIAVAVVRECRIWGQQNFGLSLGQMIQKMFAGEMAIELIQVNPPTPALTFRVTYEGVSIIVIHDF